MWWIEMKVERQKLSQGEADYITELYKEYSVNIYRLISCKLYWNYEDNVFECLQETFITLIEKFRDIFNVANLRAWLYRTAIHITYNFNRKKKRYYDMHKLTDFAEEADNVQLATSKSYVEDCVIHDNINELASEVMFRMNEKLSEEQKVLYELKYVQKMTNRAIGRSIKRNEKTISYQINIMKKLINRCIQDVVFEHSLQ